MRTRLILVRHAEARGNIERVFHGITDSELTSKGHMQAQKAADVLKNVDIDVLYSSSLKRTCQTAQYIKSVKGLPIIKTDKLVEINGGDWEDVPWDDLPKMWPDDYEIWENQPHLYKAPNGESMQEFYQRLTDETYKIINQNLGKNICIVTHGTAIRALMCCFFGCTLNQMQDIEWCDNTAITIIDYENDKFKVIKEGDATHLGKELSTVQNQDWWKEYNEKYKSGDNDNEKE